jgi:hypothetical protein
MAVSEEEPAVPASGSQPDDASLVQAPQKSEKIEQVRSHYDLKPEMGKDAREASRIIRLRSYNNWLKATLLQAYLFEGARVLDIGVGKGGDLTKYSMAGIGDLVAAGRSLALAPLADAVDVCSTPRSVFGFYNASSGAIQRS